MKVKNSRRLVWKLTGWLDSLRVAVRTSSIVLLSTSKTKVGDSKYDEKKKEKGRKIITWSWKQRNISINLIFET